VGRPIVLTPGTCYTLSDSSYTTFATLVGNASGGSCAPTGGQANLQPATWNAVRACGSQAKGGRGCPPDFTCWPKPQMPYQPQACVVGEGDLVCPSDGYTQKRAYYDSQDISDTRRCINSCGCGTPSGVKCRASFELHPVGKEPLPCSSPNPVMVKAPSECQKEPLNIGYVKATIPDPPYSGGSCVPTGTSTPSGGCTPKGNQTTVCCLP